MSETKVKLSTFNGWNFTDVIGYESVISDDGITYVTQVWCEVCRRQQNNIKTDGRVRGAASAAAKVYMNGTKYVTKHNVTRHIAGKVL